MTCPRRSGARGGARRFRSGRRGPEPDLEELAHLRRADEVATEEVGGRVEDDEPGREGRNGRLELAIERGELDLLALEGAEEVVEAVAACHVQPLERFQRDVLAGAGG